MCTFQTLKLFEALCKLFVAVLNSVLAQLFVSLQPVTFNQSWGPGRVVLPPRVSAPASPGETHKSEASGIQLPSLKHELQQNSRHIFAGAGPPISFRLPHASILPGRFFGPNESLNFKQTVSSIHLM